MNSSIISRHFYKEGYMKIGIIGATGAVGQVFLDLLPQSKLKITNLKFRLRKENNIRKSRIHYSRA